ncbi:MAG: hypothetical protein FWD09_08700 [Lentimicrobiaceae bacterium]|nr:hypothetical protein [Lentimicrobiaceae bacterium]
MNYVSTYRVLRKGSLKIFLPFVLSIIVLLGAIIFVVSFSNSIIITIIPFILGLIIPVLIYQHYHLNWLNWAVKYADNIPKLVNYGEGYFSIRYDRFPAIRTIFPYKKKKKEIEDIVFERNKKNLMVVKNDNVLLSDTYFYNSILYYGFFFLLGLLFLSLSFIAPLEGFEAILVKIISAIIGSLIVFWSFKKILNRDPVFSVGKDGVLIKNRNLKWNEIENIVVGRQINNEHGKRHIEKYVKVIYKEKNGTSNSIKIHIITLNSTFVEVDEIVGSYKNKYLLA